MSIEKSIMIVSQPATFQIIYGLSVISCKEKTMVREIIEENPRKIPSKCQLYFISMKENKIVLDRPGWHKSEDVICEQSLNQAYKIRDPTSRKVSFGGKNKKVLYNQPNSMHVWLLDTSLNTTTQYYIFHIVVINTQYLLLNPQTSFGCPLLFRSGTDTKKMYQAFLSINLSNFMKIEMF